MVAVLRRPRRRRTYRVAYAVGSGTTSGGRQRPATQHRYPGTGIKRAKLHRTLPNGSRGVQRRHGGSDGICSADAGCPRQGTPLLASAAAGTEVGRRPCREGGTRFHTSPCIRIVPRIRRQWHRSGAYEPDGRMRSEETVGLKFQRRTSDMDRRRKRQVTIAQRIIQSRTIVAQTIVMPKFALTPKR